MVLPRVLISNGVPMDGLDLPQGFQVDYPGEGKAFSRNELLALLPEADAVLACLGMDAELICRGKKLKLIVCYGAGYDLIDIGAATEQGIPVVNIPDTVTEATAELAMALMMSLGRRVCELNGLMHQEGSENAFGLGKHMGFSLKGATLGLVGMGRIGSRVADFGRFMGMKILYTARTPKPEQARLGAVQCSLTELMKQADFVSLHCPHTPETDGMINRALLDLMKPTAYLINTARGRVVDERALMNSLRERRIAGAGIDVFLGEPQVNPEWAGIPNVVLTPHVGSNTVQARREMITAVGERIKAVLDGEKPPNLLNPQVWKNF